ncbi:Rhamnogalacturonate lyase [Trema orientale]|uniref:rhamnogalacturonan endolyase n=1 Tax=Trema orientale TaxID=63057 RepID=A0A2P5AS64_TREOI|nr:Rhamnogalacturonate lyase [Trema orientale]
MENVITRRRTRAFLLRLSLIGLHLFFFVSGYSHDQATHFRLFKENINSGGESSPPRIRIKTQGYRQVIIMDNGLVELKFSNPDGDVIGIKYNRINNLLEIHNKEKNRGYWDMDWGEAGNDIANHHVKLHGTKFQIIKADEYQIEISFTKIWNDSSKAFPINVDKRYIMLRGYSGFYTYAILEHPEEAPLANIDQIRTVFKLQQKKFRYMAISDDRQRTMPSLRDRKSGHKLAYPEAVLLTKPSKPEVKGEVDDKYQYSLDNKDRKVHGWISSNPSVGFWIITPSHEFLTAGPMKQELTSHVGPISLSVFLSRHYGGKDLRLKLDKGETWKKVFGPISVYLNSASSSDEYKHSLWKNAKQQAQEEVAKWPYNFTQSKDFPSSDQRGTVNGQLLIRDRYISESLILANSAYVGLAAPGKAGSWQRENKGYQFWVQANERGDFSIKDVRPGNYSLHAWVPGIIGDYVYDQIITIEHGTRLKLDNLVYEPPRNGPTLWEIGIPDRSAAEFYVPNPSYRFTNRLYTNQSGDKFRQYGLWDRYTDLYPNEDLIYTIGVSDYRRDWFFAHVNRKSKDGTYKGTTWRIIFQLENVIRFENYTLQLALASAAESNLQVRFNNRGTRLPMFSTTLIGRDNSIARHGIHGLYWLYSINVPGNQLRPGKNTLYLTQSKSERPFIGLMYDYIRLEAPSLTVASY